MRLGVCIGSENFSAVRTAARLGYDFVECGFQRISRGSDEEISDFKKVLDECGIKMEALNGFMPGDLPVVGSGVDYDAVRAYVEKGVKRGAELGLKTVVFGSGRARRVPDGYSYEKAYGQLAYLLSEVVSPVFSEYSINLASEPLCRRETNIINTLSEGVMLAAMVNRDNVGCLADIYHMVKEGDACDDIRRFKGSVLHGHISYPIERNGESRTYPAVLSEYDYSSFLSALKYAGCERCSIEAHCGDFEKEAAAALTVLRQACREI